MEKWILFSVCLAMIIGTGGLGKVNGNTEGVQPENSSKAVVYSEAGALRVEGTQLTDSHGNPIQLRGVSTHGIAWFPQYVNQEFFYELRNEWNANVVRLAMYTAENGGYCMGDERNKEKLKQQVKDGVYFASNADLYVIIDWHILSDGNPMTCKEEAKQFFEEISKEFADKDNVIYEICNEPNGVGWPEVKKYAEEIIPVIRANDENAVILVGTPTWCQDVDKAAADPIEGYDNIMYSLHFYAATHTQWLRDRMTSALTAGLPMFVSEFGTCDASGSGSINYSESDDWIKILDENGISYVTWNLSNKGETSAFFTTGCSKVCDFTTEDLSENGRWVYELLKGEYVQGDFGSKDVKDAVSVQSDPGAAQKDTAVSQSMDRSSQQTANDIQGVSGDVTYTAIVSNSWEADGKVYYQYVLTLKNNSDQDIEGWMTELSFNETLKLSDSWNGDYSVNGKKLQINAKDYNKKNAAGDEITDVGFIISGSKNLKITE